MEALPPDYLQDQLRAAIEANMDMELYEAGMEQEQTDLDDLVDFRQQIIQDINI